ncbi:site-specific DNA-methyltransferase [Aliarcobacter cryaerophilus]|uniref:site-specific DNA-methyltransferase n=1 Tax=Aliarcobacter cryaerophilus TaxID=28198 RepID=UPI0011DF1B87|nr:site-specific DNA-methyltransferase [Aliarcobacter cryaerophilus]
MSELKLKKLKMQTPDICEENIKKLKELFPQIVSEDKIDFDILKQLLSNNIVEADDERYRLDWVGKKRSLLKANTPINKTLRPCKEESVDFENTKNLYIEGDNFEVLKLLQESYLNKIKMIYIDPPYNTGKDFVYRDNFTQKKDEFEDEIGLRDDEGNKLFKNTDSNGRFHSDWLSMMYERLIVARDLLKDDGVIFISIDDNEVHNLRKICDEIFGEKNFIAQIIIDGTPKNDPYVVSTSHEYCLVYMKDFEELKKTEYGISNPIYQSLIDIYEEYGNDFEAIQKNLNNFYKENNLLSDNISNYKFADENGVYRIGPIDDPQNGGPKDDRINPKTGNPCKIPNSGWRCTIETWNEWVKNDLIKFPDNDETIPDKKTYITGDRIDVLRSYHKIQTRKDTDYLKKLFELEITPFSNPKPRALIEMFIKNTNDKDAIFLDFFSGSGTLAEAVINTNFIDNGNRKFILVQLQEEIITNCATGKQKKISQAAIDFLLKNRKPNFITEIAKERIRRAGAKILEENKDKDLSSLDIGFRVLKVDSSNMKDVYYHPADLKQSNLLDFETNIKEDRNDLDLLFSIMLDLGITLDLKITTKTVDDKKLYIIENSELVVCFENSICLEVIEFIKKEKPLKVVLKDGCFENDTKKINAINELSLITNISVI